jgi:hypothetical protein
MAPVEHRGRLRAAAAALALVVCCVAVAVACSSSSSSGGACVPGSSVACTGPGACSGYQVCNQAGSGFDPCDCAIEGGNDAGGDATVSDGSGSDARPSEAGQDVNAPDAGPDAPICPTPVDPPTNGIPCGTQTCTSGTSACCHLFVDGGAEGCSSPEIPPPTMTACQFYLERCDGPEDCPSGQSCWLLPGTNSYCSAAGGESIVCHSSADCPSYAPICAPAVSPYDAWGLPYTIRTCTIACASDSDCSSGNGSLKAVGGGDAGPLATLPSTCVAQAGCASICQWHVLPPDAGGPSDAGPLPDGCVTPYSPGFAVCDPGVSSECNLQWQHCCSPMGPGPSLCVFTPSQQNCAFGWNCDGPEDCPVGQVCEAPYGECLAAACALSTFTNVGPGTGNCYCHSDADCSAAVPYCYDNGVLMYPTCNALPPPADAGIVYGACTTDAGPATYSIACGSTTCTSQSDECCLAGTSSACQPRSSSCSGVPVQCDGPEDCPAGDMCCDRAKASFLSSALFCTGQGQCSGPATVCHTSADCPASNPTCVPGDAGPFSYCQ